MKRHDRILQIVLQSPVGFDQHVLHDVADIDSPLNLLIQPHLHQPPQRIAMPLHQLIHGLGVAVFCFGQKLSGLFGFGPHARDYHSAARAGKGEVGHRRNMKRIADLRERVFQRINAEVLAPCKNMTEHVFRQSCSLAELAAVAEFGLDQ